MYDRTIRWKDHIGQMVSHFKGDKYLILDIAEHTETGEELVIYKALYGDCKVYARPMKMFDEACTGTQYAQYGKPFRFEPIKINSVKENK